jgi:hypothetical protein
MNALLPLRSFGAAVALFAAVMLIIWALVSQGFEQFLDALKSHDFQAAHDELGEQLQQQVQPDDLRTLARTLEQAWRGIAETQARELQEQGKTASAAATVQFRSGDERTLTFPLAQEHGLWKITSIEALARLAP